jgi:hypothetical protein
MFCFLPKKFVYVDGKLTSACLPGYVIMNHDDVVWCMVKMFVIMKVFHIMIAPRVPEADGRERTAKSILSMLWVS